MLNVPGHVVAALVGQFDLIERMLEQFELAVRLPRARELNQRELQPVESQRVHRWGREQRQTRWVREQHQMHWVRVEHRKLIEKKNLHKEEHFR